MASQRPATHPQKNEIERSTDVIVKTTARNSSNKLFIIQHIDRKTPLDEIATMRGMTFDEVISDVEHIIYSGTKLNIDYFIEDYMDEEKQEEIYEYFLTAETDNLSLAQSELGSDFSREEIQLVRAKFYSEMAN
jgi:ATP-dependent DNA helicase RecQ